MATPGVGAADNFRFQLLAKYALGEIDREGLRTEARRLLPRLQEEVARRQAEHDEALAEFEPPAVPVLRPTRLPKVRDNLVAGLRADTAPDKDPDPVFSYRWDAPEWQHRAVHAAELYWVAKPMSALVESAMTTLPAHDRHRALWPSGCGFLVYEAAFPAAGADDTYRTHFGSEAPVRAIAWGPAADGINILTFGDLTAVTADIAEGAGRVADADTPLGRKFGDTTAREEIRAQVDALAQRRLLARYNSPLVPIGAGTHSFTAPAEDTAAAALATRLLTTWLLMSQPLLSDRTHLPADRDVARAYKRQKRPVPDVTLVDLRHVKKPTDPDAEPTIRTYSSRWVVRGHWRNQAYGPAHSLRRPVFIPSYVKGPDEAPLRLTEHVNVWRR